MEIRIVLGVKEEEEEDGDEEEEDGEEAPRIKREKLLGENNEDEGNCSSTSIDDLEVCAKCGLEGEVLECDRTGCELLWHQRCLPDKYSSESNTMGWWFCPAKHVDVCFACEEPGGRVLVCDSKDCKRVFHLDCLPELGGKVPKPSKVWECPECIKRKSLHGLRCGVCNLQYITGDALLTCHRCNKRAVHVGCITRHSSPICSPCSAASSTTVVDVELQLQVDCAVKRAQVFQILTNQAHGLTREQSLAILNQSVLATPSSQGTT
ncbi:hypothetical protein BASA81_009120 [Batrachochytrium salamandrivorans]|nr:hypothetical protein BASA81_009120 [Batrachochytrium salamandrivorans]